MIPTDAVSLVTALCDAVFYGGLLGAVVVLFSGMGR
jgi:hypothetical protein